MGEVKMKKSWMRMKVRTRRQIILREKLLPHTVMSLFPIPTMGAAAGAAGAFWWTTVVSRGPIMESTARWAMALPVPMAAPEAMEGGP